MTRRRVRCVVCGEEVHPDHPLCCNSWGDVEDIPDSELRAYERELPVDIEGKPYGESD